jgi:hypothetical protein
MVEELIQVRRSRPDMPADPVGGELLIHQQFQ